MPRSSARLRVAGDRRALARPFADGRLHHRAHFGEAFAEMLRRFPRPDRREFLRVGDIERRGEAGEFVGDRIAHGRVGADFTIASIDRMIAPIA